MSRRRPIPEVGACPGRGARSRGAAAVILALAGLVAAPALAGDTRTLCDFALAVGELPEGKALGFADVSVGYTRPKVFPPDATGRVRCRGLVRGSAASATNKLDSSSAGTMKIAFASADGAPASSAFLRCEVHVAGDSASAADFPVVTVLGARDSALAPLDPLPAVTVGEVRCGDEVIVTTTTSTTTTTLPSGSTTTTTLAPEACSFVVGVESAVKLRRARFDVDWGEAGGEVSRPVATACEGVGSIGVAAVGGPEPRTLSVEAVSAVVVSGPAELVRCSFVPTTGYGEAGDLAVTVLLAGDENGAPLAPPPTLSATRVQCPSQTTTTTTTSTTTTTLPPPPCGDADGNGEVQASDALAALKAAVGLASPCTLTRCDTDSDGSVKAADALRILRVAVGSDLGLDCPD